MNDSFQFFTDLEPLVKGEKPEETDRWIIRGIASTSRKDTDGEVVNQLGLDIGYFLERGWINYNHSNAPEDLIGIPVDGKVTPTKFFIEGELLKSQPRAREVWNLACALQKSGYPRRLGLSIEGKIVEREGNIIKKAVVYNVSVCPHPINPDATFEAVVKALTAGYAGAPQGATQVRTGGSALITQSLDTDLKVQTYEPMNLKWSPVWDDLPEPLKKYIKELLLGRKTLTRAESIAIIQLLKGVSREEAARLVDNLLNSEESYRRS